MDSELVNYADRLGDWIEQTPPGAGSEAGDDGAAGAAREQSFNARALELFALQYAANPAYRRLCEQRGVRPADLTHWSQIPSVPTAAFKELDLTCLPAEQRERVFHSSGTTAQKPSRHFHSARSLALYERSAWRWFSVHVTPEHRRGGARWRGLFLTPPPDQAPHSSLVHMFEVVRRELGLGAEVFAGRAAGDEGWGLDAEGALRGLERACERGEPVLILATAFSLVHLLEELSARGARLNLPAGSRVMETGGYKGRVRALPQAELHANVGWWLGVPPENIVCEYGMCELSSQAYDRIAGAAVQASPGRAVARRFRFPPWARVQVVSPETGRQVAPGQTGLLRVFDLANVFSVLAVQTEDLAVRVAEGFELVGRAAEADPRGCSLQAL